MITIFTQLCDITHNYTACFCEKTEKKYLKRRGWEIHDNNRLFIIDILQICSQNYPSADTLGFQWAIEKNILRAEPTTAFWFWNGIERKCCLMTRVGPHQISLVVPRTRIHIGDKTTNKFGAILEVQVLFSMTSWTIFTGSNSAFSDCTTECFLASTSYPFRNPQPIWQNGKSNHGHGIRKNSNSKKREKGEKKCEVKERRERAGRMRTAHEKGRQRAVSRLHTSQDIILDHGHFFQNIDFRLRGRNSHPIPKIFFSRESEKKMQEEIFHTVFA